MSETDGRKIDSMRRVKYIYVLTIGILIYGCEAEIPARNVPYKLDIDIYPSYSGESLSPVIIFIHGGAWTGGDKDHWGPKQIEAFRGIGFTSISINYPTAYRHPAHIQSIAKTLKWIQDSIHRYGGNARKIVLAGHSAGAHLAALATINQKYFANERFDVTNIRLVCSIDAGSYMTLDNGRPDDFYAEAYYRAAGFSNNGSWWDFTPANHIVPGKKIPPMYLIYSNDPYRIASNKSFARRLKKGNVEVKCHEVTSTTSHNDMLYEFPVYSFADSSIIQTIVSYTLN